MCSKYTLLIPLPFSIYSVVKEQWIMAKYDREQFLAVEGVSRKPYMTGENSI